MRWIGEGPELKRELKRLGQLLRVDVSLPEQVFTRAPHQCMVLEFDPVLAEDFLEVVLALSGRLGEDHLVWGVLSPDPENYFVKHFGKAPWLRIEEQDSVRQAILSLLEDPGGSPADAPGIRADRVVLYGGTLRWLIFADREMELGILGCFDETACKAWSTLLGRHVYTVEQAAIGLVPAIYPADTAARVARDLRANYG